MATRFSKKRINPESVFAPWTTPDERALVTGSYAYPAVLKICSQAGIKCVKAAKAATVGGGVISGGVIIQLGTDAGLRVVLLNVQPAFVAAFCAAAVDSNVFPLAIGSSKKAMYLANRVLKSGAFKHQLDTAGKHSGVLVRDMFMSANKEADSKYPGSVPHMGPATIGWLLKLYSREITEADMPAQIRDEVDSAVKAHANSRVNRNKARDMLSEIFCRDKWIIGHNASLSGYWVGMCNTSKVFSKYIDHGVFNIAPTVGDGDYFMLRQLQFYPTFESIPESVRKEIAPSQAMLNMYLEGTGRSIRFTGPERLVPAVSGASTWFDAGAVAISRNHPEICSWVLMDRV